MTREELDAIRARVEAATPGPWAQLKFWPMLVVPERHSDRTQGGSVDPYDDATKYAHPIAEVRAEAKSPAYSYNYARYPHRRYTDQPNVIADAAFIAHARTDIPALLAEVDRLRAGGGEATEEQIERAAEVMADEEEVITWVEIGKRGKDHYHDLARRALRAALVTPPARADGAEVGRADQRGVITTIVPGPWTRTDMRCPKCANVGDVHVRDILSNDNGDEIAQCRQCRYSWRLEGADS